MDHKIMSIHPWSLQVDIELRGHLKEQAVCKVAVELQLRHVRRIDLNF